MQALRESLRHRRRGIPITTAHRHAQQILPLFLSFLAIYDWQHIAVYAANDGEIDPAYITQWCWQYRQCYLPILGPKNTLNFAKYNKDMLLKTNRFAIAEPVHQQLIQSIKLDVVLLPLVAFDKTGNRLGRGGGFYDKTFANSPKPFLLGLAHDFQEIDNLVPKNTDIKLNGIITNEKKILLDT